MKKHLKYIPVAVIFANCGDKQLNNNGSSATETEKIIAPTEEIIASTEIIKPENHEGINETFNPSQNINNEIEIRPANINSETFNSFKAPNKKPQDDNEKKSSENKIQRTYIKAPPETIQQWREYTKYLMYGNKLNDKHKASYILLNKYKIPSDDILYAWNNLMEVVKQRSFTRGTYADDNDAVVLAEEILDKYELPVDIIQSALTFSLSYRNHEEINNSKLAQIIFKSGRLPKEVIIQNWLRICESKDGYLRIYSSNIECAKAILQEYPNMMSKDFFKNLCQIGRMEEKQNKIFISMILMNFPDLVDQEMTTLLWNSATADSAETRDILCPQFVELCLQKKIEFIDKESIQTILKRQIDLGNYGYGKIVAENQPSIINAECIRKIFDNAIKIKVNKNNKPYMIDPGLIKLILSKRPEAIEKDIVLSTIDIAINFLLNSNSSTFIDQRDAMDIVLQIFSQDSHIMHISPETITNIYRRCIDVCKNEIENKSYFIYNLLELLIFHESGSIEKNLIPEAWDLSIALDTDGKMKSSDLTKKLLTKYYEDLSHTRILQGWKNAKVHSSIYERSARSLVSTFIRLRNNIQQVLISDLELVNLYNNSTIADLVTIVEQEIRNRRLYLVHHLRSGDRQNAIARYGEDESIMNLDYISFFKEVQLLYNPTMSQQQASDNLITELKKTKLYTNQFDSNLKKEIRGEFKVDYEKLLDQFNRNTIHNYLPIIVEIIEDSQIGYADFFNDFCIVINANNKEGHTWASCRPEAFAVVALKNYITPAIFYSDLAEIAEAKNMNKNAKK